MLWEWDARASGRHPSCAFPEQGGRGRRCRGWCACTRATWRTSRRPPRATSWPCLASTAPPATPSPTAPCGARARAPAPGHAALQPPAERGRRAPRPPCAAAAAERGAVGQVHDDVHERAGAGDEPGDHAAHARGRLQLLQGAVPLHARGPHLPGAAPARAGGMRPARAAAGRRARCRVLQHCRRARCRSVLWACDESAHPAGARAQQPGAWTWLLCPLRGRGPVSARRVAEDG